MRIIGHQRDFHLDLAGGNRIPTIAERRARSIAELRAVGVGVDRVLLMHDGTPDSSDLYESLLTMLDPGVRLDIVQTVATEEADRIASAILSRAKQVARQTGLVTPPSESPEGFLQAILGGQYDAVVARTDLARLKRQEPIGPDWVSEVLQRSNCRVFLAVESAALDAAEKSEQETPKLLDDNRE